MGSQLNPCIAFNGNARQAMEFYQEVLGGKLALGTYGDFGSPEAPNADADKVMHSVLSTSDGYTVMAWDVPERVPFRPGNNVALFLGGDDAKLRDYFEKLSAGGTVTLPLERQSWGDEAGSLVDKFGISWMVNITQRHS
ncbi:VOC family protein [Kutzneria sp. CA-103260]|uniref:VOC family protein n=1 Tax=Kutzneria sp. CA-103260 TaxID=2802641 RepID=UPI001BA594A6|nr:VOC family protein [Kutzneria sp. CA-103260]QUQ67091.1 PhnB protein [Kutzneria sp. CA-103260]